jgi:hypothetical protein
MIENGNEGKRQKETVRDGLIEKAIERSSFSVRSVYTVKRR